LPLCWSVPMQKKPSGWHLSPAGSPTACSKGPGKWRRVQSWHFFVVDGHNLVAHRLVLGTFAAALGFAVGPGVGGELQLHGCTRQLVGGTKTRQMPFWHFKNSIFAFVSELANNNNNKTRTTRKQVGGQ
jgi:hypothetical protein